MKHSPWVNCMIASVFLYATCNGSYQTQENDQLQKDCQLLKNNDKGFIRLISKDEPGEPLIVYGKILDKETKQPVSNASLFLYQTDSSGIYNTTGIDREARIKGTVYSSKTGCFKIQTILPGDYPGNKNSRHLHYIINAPGYEELKSAVFFKGFTTPNLTDQGPLIILNIKKDNTGAWTGTTDFYLQDSKARK